MLESAESFVVFVDYITERIEEELTVMWEGMISYADEMLSMTQELCAAVEDVPPVVGSPGAVAAVAAVASVRSPSNGVVSVGVVP